MKKIAVMGLYNFENLGDPIITECVKYLVEQEGYEAVAVGFQPERSGRRFEIYKNMRKLVGVYFPNSFKDFSYYLIMKWFVTPHCREIMRESDALVFGVGSYKYSTQNLWMTFSIAIDLAKKYNKPVMFHGVNIEKYDASDWRCRHLAERSNYEIVKAISTRDGSAGVERLKSFYLKNKSIQLFDVGDSAFWLKECYGYEQGDRSEVIGINLIRKGIFKDYGGNFSDGDLLKLYVDMLRILDEKGIKWELFSNGMKEDVDFGKAVLLKYGADIEKTIICPATPRELIKKIGSYKAIVGARLHACVIAYITDTPFAGFYWDNKLVRFAEDNELENRYCSECELSGNNMIDKLLATIDLPYNDELKNSWKEKNRQALRFFLKNIL